MDKERSSAPRPEICVTASDLVRRFGVWRDRATRQPVFILHRGNPRLVLTSIDMMRHLCAVHQISAAFPVDHMLLDAFKSAVMMLDTDGMIVWMNGAAATAFSKHGELVGKGLAQLTGAAVADHILHLAERAHARLVAERTELSLSAGRYRVTVIPRDDGTMMLMEDLSEADRVETACGQLAAMRTGVDTDGASSWLRLDLRGNIVDAGSTCARLTGHDVAVLRRMRLIALVVPDARAGVLAAIEQAANGGDASTVVAALECARIPVQPVTITLVPECGPLAVEGVTVLMKFASEGKGLS